MTHRPTVLLVDDCEDDRILTALSLAREGTGRLIASLGSGQEAIDYFAGRGAYSDRRKYPVPNLLLLDLRMPGLDGFHVLQWLRQNNPGEVIVVALSGTVLPEELKQVMSLGAHFYMGKDFEVLRKFLKELMRQLPVGL